MPIRTREPRLPSGKDFNKHPFGPLHYGAVTGKPVVNGIAPGDVGQGNLGDCFFLSSLVAVANTHPEVLQRALTQNRDGTYTVTFAHGRNGKPVAVTVDGLVPETKKGAQTFGRGLTPGEQWPAIFEKAYAKLQGGYNVIDGGGYGDDALRALTGKPATTTSMSKLSDDQLWALISKATQAGKPIVTSTPEFAVLKKRVGRADLGGLIDDHMYAVLGVSTRGSQRFVKVYTPLLPKDAGGPKTVPRTLELPLADWRRYFEDVTVGAV